MMKSCNICSAELILGVNWTEARKKHHMNSCNSCNTLKSKTWKEGNKEKASISARYTKVKSFYGLSKEEYDLLYSAAKGCCSICSTPDKTHRRGLHVDHDHTTGKVRGLLCGNCNTAIGKLKDSIVLLEKAKEYLIRNKNEN